MSEQETLEQMYKDILNIVHREIGNIKEKEKIPPTEVKSLETYDKIVRAALDYYNNRPTANEYTEKSTEELEAELEK